MLIFLLLCLLFNTHTSHSRSIQLGSSLSPATRRSSWSSSSGRFSFGFYQDGGSGFSVGIWLAGGDGAPKNTVVWTENRDDPPLSFRATVNFTADGELVVWDGETRAIAELGDGLKAASASMLDSGNFVLYDEKLRVIWQTFDHPTDTILGGQKLTVNGKLVSSKSASDHSSGRFYLIMQGDENLVAYPVNRTSSRSAYWASGTNVYRGGSDVFLYLEPGTGALSLVRYPNDTVTYLNYGDSQKPDNDSKTKVVYRATLGPDGNFALYSHSYGVAGDLTVAEEWSALENLCDNEAYCGLNSYCSKINGFIGNCTCLPGFLPRTNFKVNNTGCYPGFLDEDDCQGKEAYQMTPVENINWGGSPYSGIIASDQTICGENCRADCDCWGALFDNGTCNKYKLPFFSALLNPDNSITAWIKSNYPGKPMDPVDSGIVVESKKKLVWILSLSLGLFAVLCSLLAFITFFLYRRRAHKYQILPRTANQALINVGEFTLRCFSYDELEKATDGFKEIIGTNPCGAVYKGSLSDQGNRKIAVKTLENVEEGESKFRTEMTAVGRTHHRNLVQLLGFCIEGSRKLLVYEFMNNGSLADFLFKGGNEQPPWKDRVRIALDIARGILYLHEECESRIIHCNIKPQNILLSDSWTAKISEFGLAKLLMDNQSGTFTGAKGTGGYMAPEWQKTMLITEKVDVYSFGVVLFEIICCKSTADQLDVPTTDGVLKFDWVYDCFLTNNLRDFVGGEEVDMKVLERMVKVGLLCVQDDATLRPAMKNVILMLEGTMSIPEPQP